MNAGAGGSVEAPKATMGKNEFLKLLLAQLSHQDPTSPADSQAFVAQLAQFANVEQLQGVNTSLETLLMAQAAGNQTQTVGLLGKDVTFKTDKVDFDGVASTDIVGQLEKDAATVKAVITDANGKVVRTVDINDVKAGPFDLKWDGTDDKGVKLPKGTYKVQLTAADKEGKNIPVQMNGSGRVTGITYEKGFPELQVGGLKLLMNEIISVKEPTKEN
ncbi:MAG: flagellar hook assembly protein FlgD [Myxococcaceae bacterium]|nr:flagellar hook assembly protein FlgD [Myxococcaceae bacterium]